MAIRTGASESGRHVACQSAGDTSCPCFLQHAGVALTACVVLSCRLSSVRSLVLRFSAVALVEKSVAPAASVFHLALPRFTRVKGDMLLRARRTHLFCPRAFCVPTDEERQHLLPGLGLGSWMDLRRKGSTSPLGPLFFEATTDPAFA